MWQWSSFYRIILLIDVDGQLQGHRCTQVSPRWLVMDMTRPGPWFNIKMSSYQYRKSHCGDKTVVRSSYLHNGISYTGKTSSLYWIRAQSVKWRYWRCIYHTNKTLRWNAVKNLIKVRLFSFDLKHPFGQLVLWWLTPSLSICPHPKPSTHHPHPPSKYLSSHQQWGYCSTGHNIDSFLWFCGFFDWYVLIIWWLRAT